jgi:hypothetical protein
MLIEGHYDGETWGCCSIVDEGCEMYVTSGDDNVLLLYDLNKKKVVGRGKVDPDTAKKTGRKKIVKGGASTLSRKPVGQQARGLDYNTFVNHLAVGTNEGNVTIRQVENLKEYAGNA